MVKAKAKKQQFSEVFPQLGLIFQKCFFACKKRGREKNKNLHHNPVGLCWTSNRTIFKMLNTIIALVGAKPQSKFVLAAPLWKIIPPTLQLECKSSMNND